MLPEQLQYRRQSPQQVIVCDHLDDVLVVSAHNLEVQLLLLSQGVVSPEEHQAAGIRHLDRYPIGQVGRELRGCPRTC